VKILKPYRFIPSYTQRALLGQATKLFGVLGLSLRVYTIIYL